jgi:hypothetical protein
MDLEVVVPHLVGTESGEEGRFDILNPEMSFALYAGMFIYPEEELYPDLLSHRERRGARCMDLGYPSCEGIPTSCAQCNESGFNFDFVFFYPAPSPRAAGSALPSRRRPRRTEQ